MSDLIGVGDEVICIDDARPEGWSAEVFPQWVVKDSKYIVRELLENDDIVVGCLVRELRNPPIFQKLLGRAQEPAFATWRFSKLRSAYEIAEEKKAKNSSKKLESRRWRQGQTQKVEELIIDDSDSQYLDLIEKKRY